MNHYLQPTPLPLTQPTRPIQPIQQPSMRVCARTYRAADEAVLDVNVERVHGDVRLNHVAAIVVGMHEPAVCLVVQHGHRSV